jgi:hypothetical protein
MRIAIALILISVVAAFVIARFFAVGKRGR